MPYSTDNAMRNAARDRGLRVNKERDTRWQKGSWIVRHAFSRERLLAGSRDEVDAFVAAYSPGEVRLNIVSAIPRVLALAVIADWPEVREDDGGFDYVWESLEHIQKLLADFEPEERYVRPKPPPEPTSGLALLGWRGGVLEALNVRMDLNYLHLGDVSTLKAIEDEGERRRAHAEAGLLRMLVDYILEHRATWPEIAAEERAITLEAEAIASIRSDAGRHGDSAENRTFRLTKADEREAKLNERRTQLDKRLGIDTVHRYWWPSIRESREALERLRDEIIAGHHVENLPRIHEELAKLTKLVGRIDALALSADLRDRARKMRQSGDKQEIEEAG
jgi:hypothetical protein